MAFEHYVMKGGRNLRLGYTTGTCAALAAAAAATLLLTGEKNERRSLATPKGIDVDAEILDAASDGNAARCAVRKDAGDDPDATDGILVYATVEKRPDDAIVVDGGRGVGRVTRKGLEQPVGAAAINSVPRRMIEKEVRRACDAAGYRGGMSVVISIPEGETVAARTFNPTLGIVGGISVIGTSGIVEPMSAAALTDAIAVEMRMHQAEGVRRLILTPGNYGENFLREHGELRGRPTVKCSNFIGEALDMAAGLGFEDVLVVGHAGKLVKLAGGIMDTHSRVADCRMELLALHAALAGADARTAREVLEAMTVDDGIDIVDALGLREAVMESLLEKIDHYLRRRSRDAFAAGALLFTNRHGVLGATEGARSIMARWGKE